MKRLACISALVLTSCTTVYREIYYVEEYPMHWQDTVVYHPTHWHYMDQHQAWNCMEIPGDTVVFDCYDTMRVPVLKEMYKRTEFGVFEADKTRYQQL